MISLAIAVAAVVGTILATFCAGLTAFGEGIIFLVIWTSMDTVGVLGGDSSANLTLGVLMTMILSVTPMPYLLWVARKEIAAALGWAILLGACATAFVPLGFRLLTQGNTTVVKYSIGVVFGVFGTLKLWLSIRSAALNRVDSAERGVVELDTVCVIQQQQAEVIDDRQLVPSSTTASAAPVEPLPHTPPDCSRQPVPSVDPSPASSVRCSSLFSPIAPRHSLHSTAVILGVAGVAAGVFSGMLGVGGPPQIIAYSILRLEKGPQRGIRVLGGFMFNCLRIVMFATAPSPILSVNDLGAYIAIAVAAVCGTIVGTRCREHVNTEVILRILYVLVFLSTFTLFNVSSSVLGLVVYGLLLVIYCAALYGLWVNPHRMECKRKSAEASNPNLPVSVVMATPFWTQHY